MVGPTLCSIDGTGCPLEILSAEKATLNDSRRDKKLQKVYSTRSDEELASSYDEWAQDYEDDMLSLGYAIPAVAAGFVGRHVPPAGSVLDAGAGAGLFEGILRVLGYEDLIDIDISERMLGMAYEKGPYKALHRRALGEPLGLGSDSLSAAVSVGGLHHKPRPTKSARRASPSRRTRRVGDLQHPRRRVPGRRVRGEAGVTGERW